MIGSSLMDTRIPHETPGQPSTYLPDTMAHHGICTNLWNVVRNPKLLHLAKLLLQPETAQYSPTIFSLQLTSTVKIYAYSRMSK